MIKLISLLMQLLALEKPSAQEMAEQIRAIARAEALRVWRRERNRVRRRQRELHDDDDFDDEEE